MTHFQGRITAYNINYFLLFWTVNLIKKLIKPNKTTVTKTTKR